MPVQASAPASRHTPGVHVHFPVFRYDESTGMYTNLPISDGASDLDSEDGTVAADEPEDGPMSAKPVPGPQPRTRAGVAVLDLERMQVHDVSRSNAVPASSTSSVYRAITGTIWYLRMCLVLVILCTAATLFTGCLFTFIGNFAFLGWYSPYSTMLEKTPFNEVKACAVGAGVLGGGIGLCAFACLCVRRACMTDAERNPPPVRPDDYERYYRSILNEKQEPAEMWTALLVAAVAGVVAMAVGMAIVPALAAEAEGFALRHALAIGAWGLCAPLVPMAACMVVSTLWKCDPCAGANCCCETVGACCDRH